MLQIHDCTATTFFQGLSVLPEPPGEKRKKNKKTWAKWYVPLLLRKIK